MRRPSLPTVLALLGILSAGLLIVYICAFKVIDFDIWWHIAAGRMMRATGAMIDTDPFAYTRTGLPYLSRHEWLAQVILSLVYDHFGATGLIVLRMLLILTALSPVVLLHWRRAWLTFPLAVFASLAMVPLILDRPQLFSFALFSLLLTLCILWRENRLKTRVFLPSILLLHILWVNLHGGVALLAFPVVGALLLQIVADAAGEKRSITAVRADRNGSTSLTTSVRVLLMLLVLLLLATCLSPLGIGNITYAWSALFDRSTSFIREWQPRGMDSYLRWIVPIWCTGLLAVMLGRGQRVFSGVLLLFLGLLTLKAMRQDPFFILASGILLASALHAEPFTNALSTLTIRRRWLPVAFLFLGLAGIGLLAERAKFLSAVRYGYAGYGVTEPLRGAVDFLERERVTGKLFNSYEAGDYLLFRHLPVFVDGRCVDYGYVFLRDYFAAGTDAALFANLENTWKFETAVVLYEPLSRQLPLPYVSILGKDPDWALVYVDDDAAVYVRRNDEHRKLIKNLAYTVLTPEILLDPIASLPRLPSSSLSTLDTELRRAEQTSPTAIRLRLARATLYELANLHDAAEEIITTVLSAAPWRYEPYHLLALVRAEQGRFAEAGALMEESIRRAGGEGETQVNYSLLASYFEKAGDREKARRYARKAQTSPLQKR